MKKFSLILTSLLALILLSGESCIKGTENCVPKSVATEAGAMNSLALSQSMTPTTHSSGLLYEIINGGAGVTASPTSKIFVKYTAKLANGTIFDSQTNSSLTGWVLGSLIAGWQIGIPLIQKGGIIKLVVPSSMGYGCAAVGTIPSSSILYFEVELVDIQ